MQNNIAPAEETSRNANRCSSKGDSQERTTLGGTQGRQNNIAPAEETSWNAKQYSSSRGDFMGCKHDA